MTRLLPLLLLAACDAGPTPIMLVDPQPGDPEIVEAAADLLDIHIEFASSPANAVTVIFHDECWYHPGRGKVLCGNSPVKTDLCNLEMSTIRRDVVVAHELGHTFGVSHGSGVMEKYVQNMTMTVTDEDLDIIDENVERYAGCR